MPAPLTPSERTPLLPDSARPQGCPSGETSSQATLKHTDDVAPSIRSVLPDDEEQQGAEPPRNYEGIPEQQQRMKYIFPALAIGVIYKFSYDSSEL